MRLLLVFFLVVGYVLGQNSNQPITSNGTPLDFGLKKACEDVGGIFKQRENANVSGRRPKNIIGGRVSEKTRP